MHFQNFTSRFLRFNHWANQRQTSWLLSLDRSLLYQQTNSSFGTIDRTLQHLLAAQRYWYEIIVNEHIPSFDQPEKKNAVDEVIHELLLSSQQLIEGTSSFDEEQLMKRIKASDSTQSRYDYILHTVNHSSYHRGQIVTMSRALGSTSAIPVTDYDAYLWWIENESE